MLRISRYRFRFHPLDPIRFPPFPGSALRGLFGHGLKRSVCITRLERCDACLLRSHCAYTQLFETRLSAGERGNTPSPLVWDLHRLDRRYAPGESFALEATLIGEAHRQLPYLVQAWQRAGSRGLGRENARFELSQVDVLDWAAAVWRRLMPAEDGATQVPGPCTLPPATDPPDQARVHLVTPYRSKRRGRLVTPDSFESQGFLVSLIRRIASLQRLHDSQLRPLDAGPLIDASTRLTIADSRLEWRDWRRHSSRQRTHMNLGGVVGAFTLSGTGLPEVWPVLQLGQWIQAGKNTLFGLGRYHILSEGETRD